MKNQNTLKWKVTAILSLIIIVLGITYFFIDREFKNANEQSYFDGQIDLVMDMNKNLYFPVIMYNKTLNESSVIQVNLDDICGESE